MTIQETRPVDRPTIRPASTAAAGKAYERRTRREQAVEGGRPTRTGRLTRTGSPIASALSRVPFVAVIIALLAGGIVAVLWLNTVSDAAGLRASQSRLAQQTLSLAIQAANRDIAARQNPALLAGQARSLGMVPPADAAMLEVGKDGRGTVVGQPTPIPGAAPAMAEPAGTPTPVGTTTVAGTPTAVGTSTAAPATTAPAKAAATAPAAAVPPSVTVGKTAGTSARTSGATAVSNRAPAGTTRATAGTTAPRRSAANTAAGASVPPTSAATMPKKTSPHTGTAGPTATAPTTARAGTTARQPAAVRTTTPATTGAGR